MSELNSNERFELERLRRWESTISKAPEDAAEVAKARLIASNSMQPIIQSWKDSNAKLRKALEVADKALRGYANQDNWSHIDGWPQAFDIGTQGFDIAQQARTEIQNILKQVKTHES